MITFIEHTSSDYKPRTIINASSDITIAFAIDFDTSGEKLTKEAVLKQYRTYIPVNILKDKIDEENIKKILYAISITGCFQKELILNVAGNGIYTMKRNFFQNEVDYIIEQYLSNILGKIWILGFYKKIVIRSGGQTGADESGLKYGDLNGYETVCLAPKGWKFRNINGIDISNENLFKNRFENKI